MGGKENIKVVCRVRPLNDKEKKKGEHANVKVLNEQQVTPCPNLMSNFLFASFPFAPLPPVRYAPPVTEHVTLRNCLTEWLSNHSDYCKTVSYLDLFCPPPQLSGNICFMTPGAPALFLHSNGLYNT